MQVRGHGRWGAAVRSVHLLGLLMQGACGRGRWDLTLLMRAAGAGSVQSSRQEGKLYGRSPECSSRTDSH